MNAEKFRVFACRQTSGWWITSPKGYRFWRPTWDEAIAFLNAQLPRVPENRMVQEGELTHR